MQLSLFQKTRNALADLSPRVAFVLLLLAAAFVLLATPFVVQVTPASARFSVEGFPPAIALAAATAGDAR